MTVPAIDAWVARKIGLDSERPLSRDDLEKYQRRKLAEVVYYAKAHSIFYAKRLDGLTEIPFMTAADIISRGSDMLCVPASQVSRIVSLETSGSSEGSRKSIYFTEEDQELMVDYVANGLGLMFEGALGDIPRRGVSPSLLILMPAERPGSIGDLVAKGVTRIGVNPISYGIAPSDGSHDDEIIDLIRDREVTSILATPQAALRLARKTSEVKGPDCRAPLAMTESRNCEKPCVGAQDRLCDVAIRQFPFLQSVLLSGDYVSPEIRAEIERLWNCKVYEHYGMTEMGLGGAMACEIRDGYHIREADLYIEIIDPATGKVVPDGEEGEIVFTTLTRTAMPFIRYRTGDISHIIDGLCPCGSILKRLARVGSRGQTKNY